MDFKFRIKYFKYLTFIIWASAILLLSGIDWESKDYDTQGSRNSQEQGFNQSISLKWAFFATNQVPVYATPIVSNGAVLLVLQNGMIYLLREDNGSMIWEKNIFEEIVATPLVYNGTIYLLTKSCNLYMLDFATGNVRYKKLFDGTCMESVIKEGNILYIPIGFAKNKVVKFNIDTKTEVGELIDIQGQPFYAIGRLDGNQLYFTSTSGYLYKLDKSNLSTLWNKLYSSIITFWNVVIDESNFYFYPSGNDLRVYKYNKETNEELWAKALSISKPSFKVEVRNSTLRRMGIPSFSRDIGEGGSQKPSSGDNFLYAPGTSEATASSSNFATDSSSLCFITGWPAYYFVCLDKTTGNFLATKFLNVNTGILPIGAPVIKDNLVYYALPVQNQFYVSNKSGDTLSSYELNGGVYASIVAANAKLFVATTKGSLYVFETTGNKAPEKPEITSPGNFSDIFTDNVTIAWNATDGDGDPLNYILRITDGSTTQTFNNLTETSFTLNNLKVNTQYSVEIRAFETNSKKAYSVWSDKITFFYKRFQGVNPQPPANLMITATEIEGGYNFLVSWDVSPSIGVRGYKITYRKEGDDFIDEQEITTTSYTFTTVCNDIAQFGCLEENEYYEVQVKAVNIENLLSDAVTRMFFSGALLTLNDAPQVGATLQEVINNANANDTIKIAPITLQLTQPVIITKPIKIEGNSPLHTFLVFDGFEKGIVVENILGKKSFKPDIQVEISNLTIIGAKVGIEINAPTKLTHCVIAKGESGIIANNDSEIINNTIALNSANAISINNGIHVVKNNIIVENGGVGINLTGGSITILKYNLFFGNQQNNTSSNISVDSTNLVGFAVPFVDRDNNDFRELDGVSPSIDTGDPADDFSQEPLPNGGRINIGAFGNTQFAGKSIVSDKAGSQGGGGCYVNPENNLHTDGGMLLLFGTLLIFIIILSYLTLKSIIIGSRKNI